MISIKKLLKTAFPGLVYFYRSLTEITNLYNSNLYSSYQYRINNHKNPLCRYGKKVYSQADEDGITMEIIRRLNIDNGKFIELGVGTGIENNTLILMTLGWSGFWIGGENILLEKYSSKRFNFNKAWITVENIVKLIKLNPLYCENIDLLSIDLDGNDIYFLDKILSNNIHPKIIIAEYNSKFPPPILFSVDYKDDHLWMRSDYQSSSLQSIVDLLSNYEYRLICCNAATGVNAFFVKTEFLHLFPEVPASILDIYSDPFHLFYSGYTWPADIRTIEKFLR